jgi:hypothetical protein
MMTNILWYHAAHEDSEAWFGGFKTREEAIVAGQNERDGYFWVCLATSTPLRLADWLGLDDILERAEETFADSERANPENDDEVFSVSGEQAADLQARLSAACDEWQAAHGLIFAARTFDHMEAFERIEVTSRDQVAFDV